MHVLILVNCLLYKPIILNVHHIYLPDFCLYHVDRLNVSPLVPHFAHIALHSLSQAHQTTAQTASFLALLSHHPHSLDLIHCYGALTEDIPVCWPKFSA